MTVRGVDGAIGDCYMVFLATWLVVDIVMLVFPLTKELITLLI